MEDRERCMQAGMNAYLSKPINGKALLSTIAEVHVGADS
jgi:CheY-like chemotaxis protein